MFISKFKNEPWTKANPGYQFLMVECETCWDGVKYGQFDNEMESEDKIIKVKGYYACEDCGRVLFENG